MQYYLGGTFERTPVFCILWLRLSFVAGYHLVRVT